MTTQNSSSSKDQDEMQLPGFRFHPTDEELVGFYLRRKVDKRPIGVELIKQIDIYKHDPWDLPKINTTADKEGYFFCRRGRKYRNSIRPNRVTGSGFWKATGIDKPVYSQGGAGRDCIGLKKTLVYYRGTAGKGTKTDWMMHEFRLPSSDNSTSNDTTTAQEAEVWTICRIFMRNLSYRKHTQDSGQSSSSSSAKLHSTESTSKTYTPEHSNKQLESYISFEAPFAHQTNELMKPAVDHLHINEIKNQQQLAAEQMSSTNNTVAHSPISMASSSSFQNTNGNELLTYENWDELRSMVEFAFDPSPP